jgi:hypothetical protein
MPEVVKSSYSDPKAKIIRRCAGLFHDIFKDLNWSAMSYMKNSILEKHREKLDLKPFSVRFNCPDLLSLEFEEGVSAAELDNWETIDILLEVYLFQVQEDYGFDFSMEEMSDLAAEVAGDYDFFDPESSANGEFFPSYGVFYLYRVTEMMEEKYTSRFETEVDNLLNRYDYGNGFLEALRDFPEKYRSRPNGSGSLDRHVKTFVHEYLHFIYDSLDIERSQDDKRQQTVNEAYSWFISYLIAEEQGFNLGKPSSSAYDEPEKIEELSKLLLEKYREEADVPAVSFAIELQEDVYSSDLPQIEAMVLNLMPGDLRDRMKEYGECVSEIREIYRDFSRLVEDYEALYPRLRKDPGVDNKMAAEYRDTLQDFEEDLEESKPERSVDDISEKMADKILKEGGDWDDVSKIFYGTALMEYRSIRSLVHDVSRLERELRSMKDFDESEIERRVESVEGRERNFVGVNSLPDVMANLVILQDRIEEAEERMARIKR